MSKEPFLPTLRELARCFQAFEAFSAAHIRTLDLTPPQFDILATLGNTAGMSFKQLGAMTLITKGTLTGVVDRLEHKRLVERVPSLTDGRSQIVRLTRIGEALFARVFPAHVAYVRKAFAGFTCDDYQQCHAALERLRLAFEAAPCP